VNTFFATGDIVPYFYKLTAEYDNAILGESGPSAATRVIRTARFTATIPGSPALADESPIGPYAPHTLDLDDPGNRYDMTDDVTRIHVYRTIRGATEDGTYYRVGSVTCTLGAPTADFVDDVKDDALVKNDILDEDRFLPPKYRTAVIWKDRMVIGNLKARQTNAAADTELDLEETGIHKNRIRFSEAFAPDNFRSGFFQDILPDGDSGSIVRLIVSPRTDALFVFMENDVVAITDPVGDSVSALSFRPINIANSKGTPAPLSVVEYDGMIFYWTKSGIEVISGYAGRTITSKSIRLLWNLQDSAHARYGDRINMSQIARVRGIADKNEERIYWSYPAATGSANSRTIILDYGVWRDRGYGEGVFSINSGVNNGPFEAWNGEGDRGEIFAGDDRGVTIGPFVYRVNFGNVDERATGVNAGDRSDFGISSYFYHGHTDFSSPTMKAMSQATIDMVSGAASVIAKLDVDDGKLSTTLATTTWTAAKLQRENYGLPRTAVGKTASLQIETTDAAAVGPARWQLEEIAYIVDDLPSRMRP